VIFFKFGDTFEQIALHDLCSPFKLTKMNRKLLKHKRNNAPEEQTDSLVLFEGRVRHNWIGNYPSEVYTELQDVLQSSTQPLRAIKFFKAH
jgi:hypothetical protein